MMKLNLKKNVGKNIVKKLKRSLPIPQPLLNPPQKGKDPSRPSLREGVGFPYGRRLSVDFVDLRFFHFKGELEGG